MAERARVGTRVCCCDACGRVFESVGGFDRHRAGDYDGRTPSLSRRCRGDAELAERGMVVNERGRWTLGRTALLTALSGGQLS